MLAVGLDEYLIFMSKCKPICSVKSSSGNYVALLGNTQSARFELILRILLSFIIMCQLGLYMSAVLFP